MTTTLSTSLPRIGTTADPIGEHRRFDRSGLRREPVTPAGKRNVTRIAVGLIVIVVSVLGSLTLYSTAGDRTSVLALRRDVAAGQRIGVDDLKEVSISIDASVTTLRATEASHVIGKVAKVTLVGGALLVPSQIGEAPELSADQAVVGAVLKPGQYPTQLEVGSTVRVVEVPTADSTGRIEPVSHGVGRVADIAESASDSSIQVVSLVVDRTTSEAIASAGASGRLSLIVEGVS